MGGKSSQSTSTVQIPPEVLARYNAVNARAETAAAQPFQNYTGQFVAGLTPEQQAATAQTAAASQTAQPYYQTAAGLTLGANQNVGPLTSSQINQYMNPFTQAVVTPTMQALLQQQGQQKAQQQAQAIQSGGFGERSDLARAQLEGQQNLALGQAIAPIYEQGYGQAVQTAAGQQNVAAADLARQMQAAQQLAGLGTGAQAAGLQGAQALMAAGTVGQQTQQADLTAQYQQFLQQRGYDFQTAQFLANIAMGTGALSGSTTSTTQPAPFFSDERLKHDAKKIGETNDGLPIYSFKYNGDDRTQIGLMAQDVEKKKPEAVGLAPAADGRMYKTVDYDKATRAKKYAGGGLMPVDNSMGGAVGMDTMGEAFARGGYAIGGVTNPIDESSILAANYQTSAMPFAEYGLRGTPRGSMPGQAGGVVPAASLPVARLTPAQPVGTNASQQVGLGAQALNAINTGKQLSGAYDTAKSGLSGAKDALQSIFAAHGGLIVPRHGYATDGAVDDEDSGGTDSEGNVTPGLSGGIPLASGTKAAKLAVAKSPTAGGGSGQRGPGNDIMDAISLTKGLGEIGGLFGLFADGGMVDRKGYADGSDVEDVVDNAPGLVAPAALKSIIAAPDTVDPGLVAVANDNVTRDSQPDYRGIVENAAKKNGIDVNHTVRLAHGESTMTPILGDDDSSAGLFQLHVGGVSKKYPNPGLGDEYFKQRRPDLLDKLSPTEKVAFLNAPENQADAADFATGHIAKNGARAWTVAREQGLFGLSGAAPSRGLDVGSMLPTLGRSGPGLYSGKPADQASLGDIAGEFLPKGVPTSGNFWVPALSGLGAMLGSKSHTLAGAIGEGLVGGVSGYQQQQKQEIEAVKNIFDVVKNQYTQVLDTDPNSPTRGQMVFRSNMSGGIVPASQVASATANMLTAAGYDPAKWGLGRVQTAEAAQPGAGAIGLAKQISGAGTPTTDQAGTGAAQGAAKAPDTGVEAAKPPEQAAPPQAKPKTLWSENDYRKDVLANPDNYGFTRGGDNDPNTRLANIKQMRADAALYAKAGNAVASTEAARLTTQANQDETNLRADIKAAYDNDYQIAQQARKDTQQNANEYIKKIQDRESQFEAQKGNIIRLSDAFARAQMGPLADKLAFVSGAAKTFGFNIPQGQEADVVYANKLAMKKIVEDAASSNMLRAPKAILGSFEKINAAPTMDPSAAYKLLGDTLSEMTFINARDRDSLRNHRGEEPALHTDDFEQKFGGKNYTAVRRDAYNQIAVPRDAKAGAAIRDMQEEFKPVGGYTPRLLETQAPKSRVAVPEAAPAASAPTAPAAPQLPTVKNEDDYNALQPGPYIAPDGTIRTKAGRRP